MAVMIAATLVVGGAGSTAAEILDAPQRVELPDIGLAVSYPARWHVMTPMTPRES